jgi:tRNA(Ile)-lysidine synthase
MKLFYEQKTGAMINLPGGAIARRDAFGVELTRGESAPPAFAETPLDLKGTTYVAGCGTFSCEDAKTDMKKIKNHSKFVAFFDTMSLGGSLTVRSRRQGDVFHPLGAPGKKSLKKYFIDKKISRFKRDYIPLVANGDEILWIVGHEISERAKLDDESIAAKKITFNEEE